jgi:cyclic pyranopterin phosphate synthase
VTEDRRISKVRMVDVSDREVTHRVCVSSGRIRMGESTLRAVREGAVGKGDVLAAAQVSAMGGAKLTPYLLPLCHPLSITGIDVEFAFEEAPPAVVVRSSVSGHERTGYEMEALTSTTVALLTIYDMLKPMDDDMEIGPVVLESKSGGKSGTRRRKKTTSGEQL